MTRTRFVSSLAILLVLSARPAWGLQITLNPDKDNTLIQRTDPNAQYSNGAGDIFSGRTNQDGQAPAVISIRRGLIHFDIATSGIPSGATITDVTLTLRDVMGNNGNQATRLQRVLADWGEGTSFQPGGQGAPATQDDATWLYRFYNAASPSSSPTWTTPGGDFSPTVSATTVVNQNPGVQQNYSWNDPQMILDVQDWLDNPVANFGWIVLGNETMGQTAKRFRGSETIDAPITPPALLITYELAAVPEPATLVLAVVGLAMVGLVHRTFSARARRS